MASDSDMEAARGTYEGFISLLKVGTVISVLVTTLVVILLTS
ncbi:MAG: aa3-type cytochrome c oxidase subunit IV [Blastomonas sp.]